jgi:hypothetical protein
MKIGDIHKANIKIENAFQQLAVLAYEVEQVCDALPDEARNMRLMLRRGVGGIKNAIAFMEVGASDLRRTVANATVAAAPTVPLLRVVDLPDDKTAEHFAEALGVCCGVEVARRLISVF